MNFNIISNTKSFFFKPETKKSAIDSTLNSIGKFKYYEAGSGETIVLLYGLFGSKRNYQGVIDQFSKDYHIIVPELPIYEIGSLTTVSALAEHVQELLVTLKIEQYHLVGNSLGGHIALLLAINYPQYIKSLILVGSSGLFENGMGDSYPKRGDYDYIKSKTEKTFYRPSIASKDLVDEIFETVNNKYKAIQILSLAKSTIKYNLKRELHKITCPCCIIWGEQDEVTPPEVGIEFHLHIAHSKLYWIGECGHVPMLEAPDKFNKILANFLFQISIHFQPKFVKKFENY